MKAWKVGISVAIALLVAVPASVSAAKFTAAKYGEQIVEGHTVFTVLQKQSQEQGWDIVIKVREIKRGPNVLWFNDQWKTFFEDIRQPCGGYVIATWTGFNPASIAQYTVAANGVTQPLGLGITYIESYHITDPNGAVWDTDLYAITGIYARAIPVWISTILNSGGPDDGVSDCDGILDLAAHDPLHLGGGPSGEDVPYYDNLDGLNMTGMPIREYNADIFGLWKDVAIRNSGVKSHGQGGLDNTDGTGCEESGTTDTEWQCDYRGPDNTPYTADDDEARGTDDKEGNSHPYNPYFSDAGPRHMHNTTKLDVYFFHTLPFASLGGYPPNPRNYAVYDTESVESEDHDCNRIDTPGGPVYGFYNHSVAPSKCGLGFSDT